MNGLVILSAIIALESVPAQRLEDKTENLYYDISCFKKIGNARFNYKQERNKYYININAETVGLNRLPFFNREYNFIIDGNISNNNFLPKSYIFTNRNKSSGNELIKAIQNFNFINLEVESRRYNKMKEVYNIKSEIISETRDVISALMELRTKPLQKDYTFKIVEKGKGKEFKVFNEGEKNIKINNINYKANKFKIMDTKGYVKNLGQEAFIYLDANGNRAPLKASVKKYGIGEIIIEIKK